MTTARGNPRPRTPHDAWAELVAGNNRFVDGASDHPHQSIQLREELATGQTPFATVFGCSDSRVAAEIIFDQGLGDVFVVRTAGTVIDPGVLGSLEFGVEVLGTPLIVVLSHTSCGAIRATLEAVATRQLPGGFLRDVVERIAPSYLLAGTAEPTPGEGGRAHLRHVVSLLVERSRAIRYAVERGDLAIVGAEYGLAGGAVEIVTVIGDVGAPAGPPGEGVSTPGNGPT